MQHVHKSLTIAQVITGSEYMGGAETHLRDLVTGLQSEGHSCIVMCGPPHGLFCEQMRARGVPVRLVPALRKAVNPARDGIALVELWWQLKECNADIVAAHTAKAGFLARLAAAALRVPCVVTPHGLSIIDRKTGELRRSFLALERLAGHLGSKLITVCEHELHLAETSRMVDHSKLAMVHNGLPDTGNQADPAKEPALITMIARFDAPKDQKTLVMALGALQRLSGWRARLVGAGSRLEEVQHLARSLSIGDRVEFSGECHDTPRLLGDSQICVLSSWREAFPISVLEAMRAGLPVVASAVGGVSEAVLDGVTGSLFCPGDYLGLSGKLADLLGNPMKRDRMGSNGRQRYLEKFTHRHMLAKTLNIYLEALGAPSLTATPADPNVRLVASK